MEGKISPPIALAGGTALLSLANMASAKLTGFPFLFCWGGYIAAPLYQSLGLITLYAVTAYILWFLYRGNMIRALGAAAVFTLIVELPRLADLLFRLGGSCG